MPRSQRQCWTAYTHAHTHTHSHTYTRTCAMTEVICASEPAAMLDSIQHDSFRMPFMGWLRSGTTLLRQPASMHACWRGCVLLCCVVCCVVSCGVVLCCVCVWLGDRARAHAVVWAHSRRDARTIQSKQPELVGCVCACVISCECESESASASGVCRSRFEVPG